MSSKIKEWVEYIRQSKKRFRFTIGSFLLIVLILIGLVRSCTSGEKKIVKSSYKIYRDPNAAPLLLMGKERNMRAFSDELILAIANKANLKVSINAENYKNLFEGLDAGKYDAIVSLLTPNVINQSRYYFSDPFYLLGPVLIVRQDSKANSLAQMEGKIVGISAGSTSAYNVDNYPSILIIPYDNVTMALDDLTNNKIDGLIMEAWPANVYTHGFYGTKLRVASSPLTKEGLRLVTLRKQEYAYLIESFNEGLIDLKKDGEYDKLLEKWSLFNTDPFPVLLK